MVLHCSVVLGGLMFFFQNAISVVGSGYCYSGDNCTTPYDWPGMCQTGKRQSPMDIPVNSSDFSNAAKRDLLLSDCYFESRKFTVENNGLFVELELQVGHNPRCTLNGSLLNMETYTFQQVSFRWASYGNLNGSQHSLNGKKYVMELHMVHYKSSFDNVYQAAASDDPNALISLSILFKICVVANRALQSIVQALESVRSANTKAQGSGLVLANFLQINSKPKVPLMQYNGSTTIPNCTETVLWNVFKDPQCISLRQLNTFRSLSGKDGKPLGDNDRPVQPLNNRTIGYTCTSIQAQDDGHPWNIFRPFTFIPDRLRLLQ